jgi:excisionase family DNA binding protein
MPTPPKLPNGLRPLLSVREAAALLGLSVRTLEAIIAEKKIVPVRVRGRLRRIHPAAIEGYLQALNAQRP